MTSIIALLSILGLISSLILIGFIGHRISVNPYAKTTYYTVGDGKTLRVGIMGDSQLISYENDPYYNYSDHLINAFKVMKEQKVQSIVFTGDIGNMGRLYAFQLFRRIFDMTYEGETEKPILNLLMGNHDCWYFKSIASLPSYHQNAFEKGLGEKPFSHKVINGYHFINWGSSDLSTITCNSNLNWAKKQIEEAIADDPTKPIFVSTHLAPYGTMYGSDLWGNRLITLLFKFYPQIIAISGHSHYALTDERAIWQGEFTAFTSQAVAYIELERGKQNGSVPKDEFNNKDYAKRNYMGVIMDIKEDKIELQRISFEKNKKYKDPWVIKRPINPSEFQYTTEKRTAASVAPRFEGEFKLEYIKQEKNKKTYKQMRFTQAVHDDLVHSYRIVFKKNGSSKEYLYFSDFFLLKEDRGKTLTILLPKAIKKGKYEVEIYAIESFGKESIPAKGTINVI